MSKSLIISLIIISCLALPGCFNFVDIDDTVAVVAYGWDIDGEHKILSAQIALPQPTSSESIGSGASSKYVVVSRRGPTFTEAARTMNLSLPRKPLWEMADVLVVSEQVAKTDAVLYIDSVVRNPRIRYNTQFFLAKGVRTEEIFQVPIPPEESAGAGLEQLIDIQRNIIGIYTPVKIKDFLVKLAAEGIQPIIPQITVSKQDGRETLLLSGTAIFQNRRMVGSLDAEQSRGLALLTPGAASMGLIHISSSQFANKHGNPIYERIALEIGDYQPKTEFRINGDEITFNIEIEVDVNIIERSSTKDVFFLDTVRAIEREAARQLQKDVMSCIEKAQSLKSDIFGWGLTIKRKNPQEWKLMREHWDENIFPKVKSNVTVTCHLRKIYLERQGFNFN
ncbi:MAG: Ger(x)C family spore germination protein [Syntrophomonadaceae bacterium]|jgi:spore germination protein KC